MPKARSKQGIPSESAMDYERAQAVWTDFATRLGDQVSQVLKDRAESQKQVYMKWMEYLRTQGVGSDDKLMEAVHEYEKLYRNWTEFADRTGDKIRESMVGAWAEQKDKVTAWQEMFRDRAKDFEGPAAFDHREATDRFWADAKNFTGTLTHAMMPKELGRQAEFPRESFENWVKFYTESYEVILKSPAFVAMLGTMLDSTLDMKKKSEEQTAEIIRTIGIPSRKDMDSLYRKIHELTQQVREQNKIIKEIRKGGKGGKT